MKDSDMGMENPYQVQACRGLLGDCSFALWTDATVVRDVEEILRAGVWSVPASGRRSRLFQHHMQFRVALAACPNACTLPQIRDIGVIATLMPARVLPDCSGCGNCEQACREGAMGVPDARAELSLESCVGCGACIRACPFDAIEPSALQLRVLVGGRMGRHPRWAEQLCLVEAASLAPVIRTFLEIMAAEAVPGERVADLVERVGIGPLRQLIHPTAGANVQKRSA